MHVPQILSSCSISLFGCFYITISYSAINTLQDEDFVADMDDSGSPTDDSGNDDSDASESGAKEVKDLFFN